MKKIILLAITLLVGCNMIEGKPNFTWDVGTTPHAVLDDGSEDAAWTAIVTSNANKWSTALVSMGCQDPFKGGDSQPVILVSQAHWTLSPNWAANETDAHIVVQGASAEEYSLHDPTGTVLVHELGHTFGLTHVFDDSVETAMHPVNSLGAPSTRDLELAAESIGCR